MRILITGKDGQLGQSINKIITNIKKSKNPQNSNQFIFVGRDELNMSNELSIHNYFNNNSKFDVIVNCAAYTAVDKAERYSTLANRINHLAVRELAKICKNQNSKLIHISTDYVFDGEKNKPYLETDDTYPINIYGQTKLDGEKAIRQIMKNNAIIIRTSWLYSEFGNNFVKTMLKLGEEKRVLNIVSDQKGSPTLAKDLSKAVITIINSEYYQNNNQITEIYNFSNIGKISWFDFATEIFKIVNINCKINPIETKRNPNIAARPKFSVMNKNKIKKKYNIKLRDWKIALSDYFYEAIK